MNIGSETAVNPVDRITAKAVLDDTDSTISRIADKVHRLRQNLLGVAMPLNEDKPFDDSMLTTLVRHRGELGEIESALDELTNGLW